MKKTFPFISLLCLLSVLTGCEKYETYSDLKEKEQNSISYFIKTQGIQVINEATFKAQNETTDTKLNQFVYFERNGVYMQIVRKGCGEKLEEKKNITLLCRFSETNLQTGEVVIRNDVHGFITTTGTGTIDVSQYVDKMNVQRTGTTINASFTEGMMLQYHGSSQVPNGWLVPLNYINVGFPIDEADEIAKVRLIVPHSQGTADASSSVVPYYYVITFQRSL